MAPPAIGGVPHPCPTTTGRATDHGASGGCPDKPRPAARQHQPQLQSPRYEGHRQDLEVSPRLSYKTWT